MEKLIEWYLLQCNGDWEHQHGFKITSLDNPALRLTVDLKGTDLQFKRFATIEFQLENSATWIYCEKTSDCIFDGYCSPDSFGRLMQIFLKWTEESEGTSNGSETSNGSGLLNR